MFKLGAECLKPRLVASLKATCSAQSADRWLTPVAVNALQRFFSQTQTAFKKYTITNHYEFDQKVINSSVPVIVNFHAEWCEPCKILTTTLTDLLANYDPVDLAVVDVEENSSLVETFEVKAVPAVLVFCKGVVIDKYIGLLDTNSLKVLIEKLRIKSRQFQEEEQKEKN